MKGIRVILIEVAPGRVWRREDVDRWTRERVTPFLAGFEFKILVSENPWAMQVTAFLAGALNHWELIEVNRLLHFDIFERSEDNCREFLAFLDAFSREHPYLVMVTHRSIPEILPRYFGCIFEGGNLQIVRP
jgi:hypothetical protein